jgi:uncharacterized protein (DUF952 family)
MIPYIVSLFLIIHGQDDVLIPASDPQELQPPLRFAQTVPTSNAVALCGPLLFFAAF